jgi:hypothetical protein
MATARELFELNARGDFDFGPEVESSLEQVRQIDREYLERTGQICGWYEEKMCVANRPFVKRHRHAVQEILDRCGFFVITGGHVAIILNRLQIFGVLETDRDKPVVAWSGGAMALSERIVLYHDTTPQGQGDAELLRAGMGLFDEFVLFPDARKRLKLEDQVRVELLASRFRGRCCVEMHDATVLDRIGNKWHVDGAGIMTPSGTVEELRI